MSRWQEEFEQHPFQKEWESLLEESKTIEIDDQTIITSVQELARLKRALEYLDNIILSIDPELTPKSIWDSFQQQANHCLQQINHYKSNKNISHLQAANQHIDNLLSYIKPYLVLPTEIINALTSSAKQYKSTLETTANNFIETSIEKLLTIEENKEKSAKSAKSAEESSTKIENLKIELLDGTSDSPSIETSIKNTKKIIESQASEIAELHKILLTDTPESPSFKSQVIQAANEAITNKEKSTTAISLMDEKLENINVFHVKIFGEKSADGKTEGGLEQELNKRTAQLNDFEITQKTRHETLFRKIEDLLPGATSAGLASAYKELKNNFEKPIKNNTKLFYLAISLMPLIAIISSIDTFTLEPLSIKLTEFSDLETTLRTMLLKIPFIAPLVWLAIFASSRRSQYERLYQEYAHKEALAKSYESYKKQLEQLNTEDTEPLQRELISRAIEAISFNASTTLDGKHRDKMPLEHALEVVGNQKDIFEKIRSLLPSGRD